MPYANVADRDAIENEMPWDARAMPVTTFALLSETAGKHGPRKATSFRRKPPTCSGHSVWAKMMSWLT